MALGDARRCGQSESCGSSLYSIAFTIALSASLEDVKRLQSQVTSDVAGKQRASIPPQTYQNDRRKGAGVRGTWLVKLTNMLACKASEMMQSQDLDWE